MNEPTPDTPPPFLGSWRNVYTALLVLLVVYIGVFHLVTVAYR